MSKDLKVNVTVRGCFKYPKVEDGTKKYAIEINEDTKAKLLAKIVEVFPQYEYKTGTDKESGLPLINVKTGYDIPVYDTDKKPLDVPIYHGAVGWATVVIKEYNYKGKRGLTAYLAAAVIASNGEPSGLSYDNIMKEVL